ncbi:MAG: hypothetical protein NC033_04660 [Clostridiales bacterium]|nr:hypothetical protein [Clostridiales bacterium]
MTKFKVCAKIHLFIIISAIVIAIGLAVGTICHFCAGGFFNYGGEFTDYKSVTVRYYMPVTEDEALSVCGDALGSTKAFESASSVTSDGGEIIYKFVTSTDTAKLNAAVDKINEILGARGELNTYCAAYHEGTVKEGGSKAITFASIALASAAAFQFIYFVIRYKLRAAYSALLACVHNLGIFVALAAITRIPVGAEMIAFGAAVVFVTMVFSAIFFDKVRKNFADERYAKSERLDVIDTSACEVRVLTLTSVCALSAAAVILGVFAAIAQMFAGPLSLCALLIFAMAAAGYGAMFFTPAVHGAIDETCEKVKKSLKTRKKSKAAKTEKPAEMAKEG